MLTVVAKSRLGLLNVPFGGSGDNNAGVELGGEKVVNAMGANIYNPLVLDFDAPETINGKQVGTNEPESNSYNITLAVLYSRGAENILSSLRQAQTQDDGIKKAGPILFTLGGDHSVSFMSLQAVLKLKGAENVRMLQIDSHTDIHSKYTSPSGNFHGMWVRPFLDETGINEIDSQVTHKLKPHQLMYVGNLNCEPAEIEFLEMMKVNRISQNEIRNSYDQISGFINNANHLHLSIDVDAFSEEIAPATGIPAAEGLLLQDVEEIFAQVKTRPSYSVDLVEYNPLKDPSGITLDLCLKLIVSLVN
jgi:arginase